ncbi:MAG: cytochrome-c peroxidase [Betaproteobacteria bacterium]|nr:cytochrome-c peroxidase [Betaproteobacteria bacterium]
MKKPPLTLKRLVWATAAFTLALALTLGWLTPAPAPVALSPQAQLGLRLFHDPSLSASGKLSCAGCHDPSAAHAPANDLPTQMGGPQMDQMGQRSTPSLRYLSFTPAFGLDAQGKPSGGFFWDGRANSLQAQAIGPLLHPKEMANDNAAALVQRLSQGPHARLFEEVFGAHLWQQPQAALEAVALALARYQSEDPQFQPFDSLFDAFLRGQATLSPAQARGWALFKDPQKGNCAACHTADLGPDGRHPLFTDHSYDNLGVPRNPKLIPTQAPGSHDLGLCARPDGTLRQRTDLCGAFKVPTLRNVATKRVFFHNGQFNSLSEVLHFYVERDTHPERWYPLRANGQVERFNDLPKRWHPHVNQSEVPYDRALGAAPALNAAEVEDVLAFLTTLTDGYRP